jgi:hypothetical protein
MTKHKIPGGTLSNGVFIPHGPFGPKKANEDAFCAPTGAPKKLQTEFQPTHGARLVSAGPCPLDNEPPQKTYAGVQVAVHSSMRSRADRGSNGDGFAVLERSFGAPKK